MATTIRLTRMGRKQAPFYRIVVCDSRTRRDGDYIESLGYYNPMPDAYQLDVDHDRAIDWLGKGAQPTDTARSLLRNEGVLYRWHLLKSGTAVAEIDAQVEQYRSRRAQEAELKAAHEEREATAKAKLQKKEAEASAAEEPAEEAVAEPAEAADEPVEAGAAGDESSDEEKS